MKLFYLLNLVALAVAAPKSSQDLSLSALFDGIDTSDLISTIVPIQIAVSKALKCDNKGKKHSTTNSRGYLLPDGSWLGFSSGTHLRDE
ncbi:hypothetical protein ACHAP5_010446 [Fusarium lateritium]